jgi:Peptidase of plants and bacteria
VEGIADCVCAKLAGNIDASNCPQCTDRFPHYKSGYGCAASFLLYMEAAHGSNIMAQLNATLRRGTYADRFFAEATGETLEELWDDFQKTSGYTPIAAAYNELDQALGDTNGQPPKDFPLRLEKYYSKHPDIKEFLTALDPEHAWPPEGIQDDIRYFLYIRQQPGGEQSLLDAEASIKELHQALGYKEGKPPEDYRSRLLAYLEAHPDMKEFGAERGWLGGQPSPKTQDWIESVILGSIQPGAKATKEAVEFLHQLKKHGKMPGWGESEQATIILRTQGTEEETYPVHRTFQCRKNSGRKTYIYTVVKASPESDWELKRAWETSAKGRIVKEFPVAIGHALP